jgi:hypothetical protein
VKTEINRTSSLLNKIKLIDFIHNNYKDGLAKGPLERGPATNGGDARILSTYGIIS